MLPHAHQILLRSSSTELNLAHPRFEGRINVDRSVVMKQNDLPVGLLCPCKLAPLPLGTHRVLWTMVLEAITTQEGQCTFVGPDMRLQRILRFLWFTNIIVFLELLVLWCGVFSPILYVFWNYWFFSICVELLFFLELLVLWCGVFSSILLVFWNYLFFGIFVELLVFWDYCYFTNIIGMIGKSKFYQYYWYYLYFQ